MFVDAEPPVIILMKVRKFDLMGVAELVPLSEEEGLSPTILLSRYSWVC
jgi:hypothetical protein